MANRLRTKAERCSSGAILIRCPDAPNENANPTSSTARARQRARQESRQPLYNDRAKRCLLEPVRHSRFAATAAGGRAPPPSDRAQCRRAGAGRARSLVTRLWRIRAFGPCRIARGKVPCCALGAAADGKSGKPPRNSPRLGLNAPRSEDTLRSTIWPNACYADAAGKARPLLLRLTRPCHQAFPRSIFFEPMTGNGSG